MPLAIYGLVLIVAMLMWPTGIQGAVRALVTRVRPLLAAGAEGAGMSGPVTHIRVPIATTNGEEVIE